MEKYHHNGLITVSKSARFGPGRPTATVFSDDLLKAIPHYDALIVPGPHESHLPPCRSRKSLKVWPAGVGVDNIRSGGGQAPG